MKPQNLKTIFTHLREIRVVKTPFTTRYEIPMNEKVESLIQMKQHKDCSKATDPTGLMILVFVNDFPGVKEISPLYSKDGYTDKQAEMVGRTQERREDYRMYEAVKTQLLL